MLHMWVEPTCAGCDQPLLSKDKTVAVIPATMRETGSYAAGYQRGKIRIMPSKGRKNQQPLVVYHERCWPGVASTAGK